MAADLPDDIEIWMFGVERGVEEGKAERRCLPTSPC